MARLILKANETYGFIGPFTPTDIIGTAVGSEKVFVDFNGKGNFDPSFNRGGDEIVIAGDSDEFRGARSGSNLLITSDFGAQISIPVGTVGAKVTFENGSFLLIVSEGAIKLGDQVISNTAARLDDVGTGLAQSAAVMNPTFESSFSLDSAEEAGQQGSSVSQAVSTASSAPEALLPISAVFDVAAPEEKPLPLSSGELFLDSGVQYGAVTSLPSNFVSLG